MSNLLGRGANAGENPVWDGTKWQNKPADFPVENARAFRQMLGWGSVGNQKAFFALSGTFGNGTVGTGFSPFCMDGRDVWICDPNLGFRAILRYDYPSFRQLQSVTAATLGFGTSGPDSVAYDGTNLYVGSIGASKVTRLTPSTGAVVNTFTFTAVRFLIYDGEKMWGLANTSISRIDNPVTPTLTTITGFSQAQQAAFDGRYLWVTDSGNRTVKRIDPYPATPVVVNTYSLTGGGLPISITFDGNSVWISDATLKVIYRIHTRTGYFESIDVSAVFTAGGPNTVGFDGQTIIATGSTSGKTIRINPTTGRSIASSTLASFGAGVSGRFVSLDSGILLGDGASLRGFRDFRTGLFANLVKQRNGFQPVQAKWMTYNFGTVGGTATLPAKYANARIIEFTGTLTSNLRVQPESNTYWVIENNMTLGANTLTFGNGSSSVNLGANGKKAIVWLEGTIAAGTFRLANLYP